MKLRLQNDKAEVRRTITDFLIDFLILFLWLFFFRFCKYISEKFSSLYINANANIVLIYLYLIHFYTCHVLYSMNSFINFLCSSLYFIRYFFPPTGRSSSEETFITDYCRKYYWTVSCVVSLSSDFLTYSFFHVKVISKTESPMWPFIRLQLIIMFNYFSVINESALFY